MAAEFELTETLRVARVFALVLTGYRDGAGTVLRESVGEVSGHPAAANPGSLAQLLFAAVRRRSLKLPARCELPPLLEKLHREAEPVRSIRILSEAGGMDSAAAAALLGLDPRLVSGPAADSDRDREKEFAALRKDRRDEPLIEELAEKLPHPDKHGLFSARNPAKAAVALGFLLLAVIVAWRFTGSMGTFPDEALGIATKALKAQASEFSPVEVTLQDIPDWFALHGYDRFEVPSGFAALEAVGVRTFQEQGETIAQVAALKGDQKLHLMSFPGEPFGINILPENTWRITTAGKSALAIQESGGTAFLVVLSGTAAEMRMFLSSLRPEAGE